MERQEIIDKVKEYFRIGELVCNHVYAKFGDKAWMFLSTELLHTLLVLRTEIIKEPIIVNTATMKQRGLRCNMCPLVKGKSSCYMSAHCLGRAIDCHVNGKTAEQLRQMIKDNADKLPYKVRLEESVNWLHLDTYDSGTKDKITMFKG